MQHIIFFGNKQLILTDAPTEELEQRKKKQSNLFFTEASPEQLKNSLRQMETEGVESIIYLLPEVSSALQMIKEQLVVIQAAGGLVYTPQQTVLLIFRRKKWDLPKGKLDEGETLEQCALRETEEETGLKQAQVEGYLTTTYHTYYENSKLVLKESVWYLMKSNEEQELQAQTAEDIEQCKWVPFEEVGRYADNMHANILQVFKTAAKQKNLHFSL